MTGVVNRHEQARHCQQQWDLSMMFALPQHAQKLEHIVAMDTMVPAIDPAVHLSTMFHASCLTHNEMSGHSQMNNLVYRIC